MERDVFEERFSKCVTYGHFVNAFTDDPYFLCESKDDKNLTKKEVDFLVRDERFASMFCNFCFNADVTEDILAEFLKVSSGDQLSEFVKQEVFRTWLEKLVNGIEVTRNGIVGVNKEKQKIFNKLMVLFQKTDKTFLFDPAYSFLWKRKEVAPLIRDFNNIQMKKAAFDNLLESWKPGMAHMDVIKALTYRGFTTGSPEDLQRCLKIIDKKSLLFLVSNPLLCKCLNEMSPNDMRPSDYETLLKRSYSSQLIIPVKLFNDDMIAAYNKIKEPVLSLTIIENLKMYNTEGASLLESARRQELFSKRFKTCDNVCEFFFRDTAKNTLANTGNLHNFGQKNKDFLKWLQEHSSMNEFKLYADVHANIRDGKVEALFLKLVRSGEDDFSEMLYDGMAKAREMVATEFAENVKDFRDIEGIKITNVNGVNVYELIGEDFTLLVRKKGGVSSCNREGILKYFEISEDWVMSTTLLSENSLRFFNPEADKISLEEVILYGFSDVEAENISLISTGDCWTKNDFSVSPLEEDDARNPFSHYAATSIPFVTYKEFQTACLLGNRDEKRGYNEVVIVPYERGDEGDNHCMPDCIVVFRTAREEGKPLDRIIHSDVIDTAREMKMDIVVIDHAKYQARINANLAEIGNRELDLESPEYSDVPDSTEVINSNINSNFKK